MKLYYDEKKIWLKKIKLKNLKNGKIENWEHYKYEKKKKLKQCSKIVENININE